MEIIYRYDTSQRGFRRMVIAILMGAAVVLAVGLYFLWDTFWKTAP
jgi:hypothetical protein